MRLWLLSDGSIKFDKRIHETIMVLFVLLRQTDNFGCVSETVKTKLFQLKRGGYEKKLYVEAKIKEEETGMSPLEQRAV